jgi:hypothetical protein
LLPNLGGFFTKAARKLRWVSLPDYGYFRW